MRMTSKLFAFAFTLVLAGCPRNAAQRPAAPDAQTEPIVSPVGNRPYTAAGAAAQPVVPSWPDARADVASAARPDAGSSPADASGPRADADRAAAERLAAQATVDRAVDQVIAGAATSLRSCFDRDSKAARKATLRLSVRAGYVTTADVSGTSDAVRTCLDQAFRGVKFEGSAAGVTSVERKLEFKR